MTVDIFSNRLDAALAELSQVIPAGQPCDIAAMMAEFITAQVDHGDLCLEARIKRRRKQHRPVKALARAYALSRAREMAA